MNDVQKTNLSTPVSKYLLTKVPAGVLLELEVMTPDGMDKSVFRGHLLRLGLEEFKQRKSMGEDTQDLQAQVAMYTVAQEVAERSGRPIEEVISMAHQNSGNKNTISLQYLQKHLSELKGQMPIFQNDQE